MKVYFTASARGLEKLHVYYQVVYEALENLGHEHLDSLISQYKPEDLDEFYTDSQENSSKLYKNALTYIKKAQLVVLEVSIPSLSMGYVMDRALALGKPVIALHKKGSNVFFASGIDEDKLQVLEYDMAEDLQSLLPAAIESALNKSDARFNFFISPRHVSYLNWIAKTQRIPRSVYLRTLIERDRDTNAEYA